MKRISFLLTDKQTELLIPFFKKITSDDKGMVVGQFFEATHGSGFVEVGFIDRPEALELQRVMGVKVGKLSPRTQEVFIEVE